MNSRSQTNCHSVDELLSGYLDGELTQQERQRVEVHVGGCQHCLARLRELGKLRASIGNLPTEWDRRRRMEANDE